MALPRNPGSLTLPLAGDREKLMLFHALNKINFFWGQVTGIVGAAAGLLLLLPVLTHRDFSCYRKAAQCVRVPRVELFHWGSIKG